MRRSKIKLWPIVAISVLCLALVVATACPGTGSEGADGEELV